MAYSTLHHLGCAARQMVRIRQSLPFTAFATMLGASSNDCLVSFPEAV